MDRRKKIKEMEDMGLRDLFKKKEKKTDDKLMPEKARIMTEEEMETEGQGSESQNRFVGGYAYAASILSDNGYRCPPECVPGDRICPLTGRMCGPGRRGGLLGVHIPDMLVIERCQTDITPFRIQEMHRPKERNPCDVQISNPMGNMWFR